MFLVSTTGITTTTTWITTKTTPMTTTTTTTIFLSCDSIENNLFFFVKNSNIFQHLVWTQMTMNIQRLSQATLRLKLCLCLCWPIQCMYIHMNWSKAAPWCVDYRCIHRWPLFSLVLVYAKWHTISLECLREGCWKTGGEEKGIFGNKLIPVEMAHNIRIG